MTAPTRATPARTYRLQREFGLLVGGVLVALGLWWLHRGKFPSLRTAFLVAGGLLGLLGAVAPRALAVPYRAWMGFAEILARIVTTVVLAIVFYLVVTPIGLFKRLRGWDPLERRPAAAAAATFWRPYPERQHDPRHFDRMY